MPALPQPADSDILVGIRQGDQKMLLYLYKRNYESIRSYIARNSGGTADAEDVLQDALVVLWQKVQNHDLVLSARLDTFIFAIAKNIWLKQLRKSGKMHLTDMEDDFQDGLADETETYNEDKYAILSKYLQQIGETCRTLLSYFYFEQWDMAQIAGKMNFANADTAKAKKHQCKKKLEQLIKQHYTAADLL